MDTCGFFARTPAVFQAVAECLLGSDSLAIPYVKLACHEGLFSRLPPLSQQALLPVRQRLARHFGDVTNLNAPLPEIEATYLAFRHIQGYEAWQSQGETIERYGLQLGPDVRERFFWGKAVTTAQFEAACQLRERFTAWWDEQLGDAVLVLPTVPDGAPLLTAQADEIEAVRRLSHDILLISVMTRRPQVTLPVTQVGGLPLGISLLGPRGSDRLLVDLAASFMQGDNHEQ